MRIGRIIGGALALVGGRRFSSRNLLRQFFCSRGASRAVIVSCCVFDASRNLISTPFFSASVTRPPEKTERTRGATAQLHNAYRHRYVAAAQKTTTARGVGAKLGFVGQKNLKFRTYKCVYYIHIEPCILYRCSRALPLVLGCIGRV